MRIIIIVCDIEHTKMTLFVNGESKKDIPMTFNYFRCPDSIICLMNKNHTNFELANLSWPKFYNNIITKIICLDQIINQPMTIYL